MPIVYRADRALGCTIAIWDGDFTVPDMRRQLRKLSADPDWPPGPRHLVDGRTIGNFSMPESDLIELLYTGTNVVGEIRFAAIVRPEWVVETGVPYQAGNNTFHTAMFSDVDAASEYLDLDPTAVQAVIDELRLQLASAC